MRAHRVCSPRQKKIQKTITRALEIVVWFVEMMRGGCGTAGIETVLSPITEPRARRIKSLQKSIYILELWFWHVPVVPGWFNGCG
jgi:hypothetical protein